MRESVTTTNPHEGYALLCSADVMWNSNDLPSQANGFNRWSAKRTLDVSGNLSDKAIAERFMARFYSLYS